MTTRLWRPLKNNAKRIGVPGLRMEMLSLRGVAEATVVPRAEPFITFLSTPSATISFQVHQTSMFDPPPQYGELLQCVGGQERCDHTLCFGPKAQWCCPDKMNVCDSGEVYAEEKASEEQLFGCGLSDVTNGTDPRLSTTSVQTAGESATTIVTTTTGSADGSNSTRASVSKSTGNANNRLDVPIVLRNLILVVNSARAIAFPVPVHGRCCGEFCCQPEEVCARGSDGPKCWPDTGSIEVTESDDKSNKSTNEVHTDVESREDDVHTSVIARGDLGPETDHGKKGSAALPTIPKLLYILPLLAPFIAAGVSTTTSHTTPTEGTLQTLPNPKTFLAKRWSCHKPKQDCGPGCWDPASQFCCQQPSGNYGLCTADKGESCCADKCCPQGYACRNQGQQYMCVPVDTTAGRKTT
jgi:hypothetical protein